MDRLTKEQRSKNMQAVKSIGSKEEILLTRALWHLGYRYRKNNKTVFGKPDITFKKMKIAIFVDSEFFHGKDFDTNKKPMTNTEFWEKKIRRNMERDIEVNQKLQTDGWVVLRFWSREIRNKISAVISEIEKAMREA
jgi:DNA mismatch endonuclease (patch repair protein)